MKAGDKARCTGARGYSLTTGKEYTILEYDPPARVEWYTWPAYVVVIDDQGRRVACHANRFEVVA